MSFQRNTHPCRGFTLVEMIVGMTITTIVLAAVASFTYSVATAWKANESQSQASAVANVATARMGSMLRGVRAIGAVREGSFDDKTAAPAAAVLWTADLNDDDAIQLSELELLCFEPDAKLLARYRPLSLVTDETVTAAAFADSAIVTRILAEFDRTPALARMDGLRFYRVSAGNRAGAIEAQFRVRSGKLKQIYSIVIALRSGVEDPT